MSTIRVGFLNLPDPPEDLKKKLTDLCKKIEISESARLWINDFHRNEIPVAAQEYGTGSTKINEELQKEIKQIYGNFFPNTPVGGIVGKIKNVLSMPSQAPPHCDRARYTAINYLLETGGPDVQTVFYKERRTNPDISVAENAYHKDVTVDFKVNLPQHRWHTFDVQQYHSVENVITERYLFSLVLKNNPTFTEFIQDYDYLLDHSSTIKI